MKKIFEFSEYKAFILEFEKSRKGFERGFRSKLAEHIGCQSGYISHVLNGKAHFSLEQAIQISAFFKLTEPEKKHFLLLVEHDRAGTKELRNYFEQELSKHREIHLNLKERVGQSHTLTESEQAIYYSNWHYLAVHVLCSLPGYDNVKSISQGLSLPENTVAQIILFLIQTGIVVEKNGKLKNGLTQVHLNRESSLIHQHHTNWRIAAIQSLGFNAKTDVHYSTVSTLSKADAEKLRGEMVQLIQSYVETVQPSREEVMYGFNLDFYGMIRS